MPRRVLSRLSSEERALDRLSCPSSLPLAQSQVQRLPGLPSSFVALDTVTGRSEIIDHQDVLNLPSERPVEPKFSLHDAMEVKLGMW